MADEVEKTDAEQAAQDAIRNDAIQVEPGEEAGEFTMRVLAEKVKTIDGRFFTAGAVGWREPPLTLMGLAANSPDGGHKNSVAIGTITRFWREDDEVWASGHFASTDLGQEYRTMIREGTISGVSADVGGASSEFIQDPESENPEHKLQQINKGTITAVTVLPMQAFDEGKVVVTASAFAAEPPVEFFSNPNLTEPTAMTITDEGHVFGHLAVWGTCHIGHTDHCLTPPRSASNYNYFQHGEVKCSDGTRVTTGKISMGAGHASLGLAANAAAEHYDSTSTAVADIVCGEDGHGIWFSGAVRPTVDDDALREFRGSAVSGDWRTINHDLEMVALLAVNTPGFPTPRASMHASAGGDENGEVFALIAAGALASDPEDCGCHDVDLSALSDFYLELADEEMGCAGCGGGTPPKGNPKTINDRLKAAQKRATETPAQSLKDRLLNRGS